MSRNTRPPGAPAAILLLSVAAACSGHKGSEAALTPPREEIPVREPVAEPAPITDIATLVGAAALGSDAAFSSVLAADKQRLDHTAPAALRDLLTSVDILRMSASQGLDYTDGVAGLVWYFNEIGIAGSEDDVIAAITDKLTGAGFAVGPPPSEHWNHFFQREDSQLRHEVMIEGPEGWTGGDREAAGVSLLWRVASRDPLPAPTFAEVVTALPYLVDDRIDASIYKALADLHVTSVTSGGTWTRYYSLSITFAASDELPLGYQDQQAAVRRVLDQDIRSGHGA